MADRRAIGRSSVELRNILVNQHFPPNWQWQLGEPVPERLSDIALFGVGPGAALVGAALGVFTRKPGVTVLLLLAVPILAVTVFRDIAALRYAAPAVAPLAVLAALGFCRLGVAGLGAGAIAALLWGSGIRPLTPGGELANCAASWWLVAQPEGTVIAVESPWDDGLPLRLPGADDRRAHLTILTLGVEAWPDT